jgi:hypothetical protein
MGDRSLLVYQTQPIAMIKYRKSLESKMLEIHREDGDWTVEELREEIAIGLKALEDGRYTDYDAEGLQGFFEEIKQKGRSVEKTIRLPEPSDQRLFWLY